MQAKVWCVEGETCNNVGPQRRFSVDAGIVELYQSISCEQAAHANEVLAESDHVTSGQESDAPVTAEHNSRFACTTTCTMRYLFLDGKVGQPVTELIDSGIL